MSVAVVVLCLWLALATQASAAFEQVSTFAGSGAEGRQLHAVEAIAVNATGAGGVPPGTFYVASPKNRVLRYGPHGAFEAAWGWAVSEDFAVPRAYERCGPGGEPAHPNCRSEGDAGEGSGQFFEPQGIAVDQATGNVYVLNRSGLQREHNLVEVFSADGSEIVTEFGDTTAAASTFAESPELIRINPGGPTAGSLTVNTAGTVSLIDHKLASSESPTNEFRIMTFKPVVPNDYSEYQYAGRAADIDAGETSLIHLASDAAGNLYTTGLGGELREYPSSGGASPTCAVRMSGSADSIAVDAVTGEPYVYNVTGKGAVIRAFSPCGAGTFGEREGITIAPQPRVSTVVPLAFAAGVEWDASRPAGVLLAVDGAVEGREEGLGHIYARSAALAPVIESTSLLRVGSSGATLAATINPRGSTTEFAFEYLTAATYESNPTSAPFTGAGIAPAGGGRLPGSAGASPVTVSLANLLPGTRYRYRVVARSHCEAGSASTICDAVGGEGAFRTFPAATSQLVDGRAYELVSPADKSGGEVFPLRPEISSCGVIECKPGNGATPYPRVVATNGEAIAYQGFPFSRTEGAFNYNGYLSQRTDSEWLTRFISPALMGSQGQGYKAFSNDLSAAVIGQSLTPLASSAAPGYTNLYLQNTESPGDLTPLVAGAVPNRDAGQLILRYAGASEDLSRIFFEANDALTEASAFSPPAIDGGAGKFNLYEWTQGQLRLVNVGPGNGVTAPGAQFGSSFLFESNNPAKVLTNAVSADGRRVFWSSEAGQVFVRVDDEVTEAVPDSGKFLAASRDGESVLLEDGHLYDFETGTLVDLTLGRGEFLGVLGQSEDLGRIYFADNAVLTPGEANGRGLEAQAGRPNVYLWHEGSITFIESLLPSDSLTSVGGSGTGDWVPAPSARSAQASPDGRWLTFLSSKKLTDYENTGPCATSGATPTAPCYEAYLYDAVTGKVICASCDPTGKSPIGTPAILPTIRPEGLEALAQPQYLDNSGRLYFNSRDALALGDSNGGVEDVYEYEPVGIGSCGQPEGCIALISTGTGSADSDFLAVDESGRNVFFTTRDRLVPQDQDELLDVYDAREGGGFTPDGRSQPAECSGEACQAVPPSPVEAHPNSPAIAAEVTKSAACRKGQVKRKGKCVKKAGGAHRHRKHKKNKPHESPGHSKAQNGHRHKGDEK